MRLTLLEPDIAFHLLRQDLAGREADSNVIILDLIEVLAEHQLHEWDEEQILALLGDADTCINDLGFQDVLLVGIVVYVEKIIVLDFLEAQQNQDDSILKVVLNGILNQVVKDQLVVLPVQLEVHILQVVAADVNADV